MIRREAVFPANRHALYEAHGYSAAIRSGDLLFVSGQVGSREMARRSPILPARLSLPLRTSAQPLPPLAAPLTILLMSPLSIPTRKRNFRPSCR